MSEKTLKPCGCGGEVYENSRYGYAYIRCNECGIILEYSYMNIKELREAWNKAMSFSTNIDTALEGWISQLENNAHGYESYMYHKDIKKRLLSILKDK